ncbi:hypothetical protein [Pseudomonas aeruginosa]|nr:hypothetical protein [Pseudomonas aeruginosa]
MRWKLFTASAKDTPACIRHSQQQQGGEVGDHLADTRVVGMPIEQRAR